MGLLDVLGGVGSAVGGLFSGIGSIVGGNINADEQEKTNAMTIDLANTQYQRRAADLKAAGINPLMAGMAGGASVPTLQAPQPGTGLAQGISDFGRIPENAIATMQSSEALSQTMANIALLNAQKDKTTADADLARTQTQQGQAEIPFIAGKNAATINRDNASADELAQQAETLQAVRDPTVAKLIQDAATSAQSQATDQVKAQELTQNLKLAKATYGADVDKAYAFTQQAVTTATNMNNQQLSQIDQNLASSELMKQSAWQTQIEANLSKKYGDVKNIANIASGAMNIVKGVTGR